MKRMTCLVVVILLGCGAVVVQGGTNRYVSLTGSGTSFYTNWAIAATSIQDAVDVSGSGDIIYITNGTYTLTNQVSITQAITLEGFNGSSNTFINGNYPQTTNRCFMISNASAIISGLTISNGHAALADQLGNGGGVYFNAKLIRNCVISNNTAENAGGGVYSYSYYTGTATITNSTITGNRALSAAGVYQFGNGSTKIKNCTISLNVATNAYGGVWLHGYGAIENCVISNNIAGTSGGGYGTYSDGCTIRNCVLVQNQAAGGGGMKVQGNAFWVENCLVMNNIADNGGGIYAIGNSAAKPIRNCTVVSNSATTSGGGIYSGGANPVFENTIVYSNTAPASPNYNDSMAPIFTNCCTTPLPTLGTGNITNNPQLADWTNNYRLTANSPCLNTGINRDWMTNAVDLDGRRRIDRLSGLVDIGAYEFINKITMFSGH